jgi:hypothetical protein
MPILPGGQGTRGGQQDGMMGNGMGWIHSYSNYTIIAQIFLPSSATEIALEFQLHYDKSIL